MPVEYYRYPAGKTVFIGSPVRQSTGAVDDLRRELQLTSGDRVVLVAGGGLGSDFLNRMTLANLERLPAQAKVILLTGRDNYQAVIRQQFDQTKLIVRDFVTNFADYLRLADVVVARAGATTIAEVAVLQKPTILVPNPKLVEGHQLKNAQRLADKQAAIVLDEFALEQQPEQFGREITRLLNDQGRRERLSQQIAQFANQRAAQELAALIVDEIKVGEGERG